jgi:tRNA(Ile)-lysidine synthase
MSDADAWQTEVERLVAAAVTDANPDRVLVGFSGGVDSTALLLAAHRVLQEQFPAVKLLAVHVNHNLLPQANAWQNHCEALCLKLEIALHVASVTLADTGNLEANARAARYQVFTEKLGDDGLLLLGHHQQDQTETLLFRLFQGRGLLPMREQGQLGSGVFARPLLSLPQSQLADYVHEHGVQYIEDASNADTRFVRNFLRHDVVPVLQARWQSMHKALARVAASHAGIEQALYHAVGEFGDTVALAHLPHSLQARVAWLRMYLQHRHIFAVSDRALIEFCTQLKPGTQAHMACSESTSLYGYAGCLYFVDQSIAPEFPDNLEIALGQVITLAQGVLSLVPSAADATLAFHYTGPCKVVFRSVGESLQCLPGGGSKSLKQLFNEAKIPPWQRSGYPLLADEQGLVCMPGVAVALRCTDVEEGRWCTAQWQAAKRLPDKKPGIN